MKYLYWSGRRIKNYIDDNGVALEPRLKAKVTSPATSLLPSIELEATERVADRHKIAARVEGALGAEAVSDFVTPPPARYAKGVGTIVFSELANWKEPSELIVAFTDMCSSDGTRVAVCLFATAVNFVDFLGTVSTSPGGWASSSAPAVEKYIRDRKYTPDSPWETAEDIAVEAVKLALRQGERSGGDDVVRKPWLRGYTIGQLTDQGEWLAEVYLDVLLADSSLVDGEYDRVLVGAPFWVRTPSIRALKLYDEYRLEEWEEPTRMEGSTLSRDRSRSLISRLFRR